MTVRTSFSTNFSFFSFVCFNYLLIWKCIFVMKQQTQVKPESSTFYFLFNTNDMAKLSLQTNVDMPFVILEQLCTHVIHPFPLCKLFLFLPVRSKHTVNDNYVNPSIITVYIHVYVTITWLLRKLLRKIYYYRTELSCKSRFNIILAN